MIFDRGDVRKPILDCVTTPDCLIIQMKKRERFSEPFENSDKERVKKGWNLVNHSKIQTKKGLALANYLNIQIKKLWK